MLLLQYGNGGGGGLGAVFWIIWLILTVLMIASVWKVFEKAGEPGWAAIIPIYNLYILLKIVDRPAWWIILYLIPIVNFIVAIIVSIDVAKAFGQGTGFGVGILLLPFIFYPLLGFGNYQYVGSAGGEGTTGL